MLPGQLLPLAAMPHCSGGIRTSVVWDRVGRSVTLLGENGHFMPVYFSRNLLRCKIPRPCANSTGILVLSAAAIQSIGCIPASASGKFRYSLHESNLVYELLFQVGFLHTSKRFVRYCNRAFCCVLARVISSIGTSEHDCTLSPLLTGM